MDLTAGMRVVLMGEGVTITAVVDVVQGDGIEVELLESVDDGQALDGVITVCVARDGGLHHWKGVVGAVADQHMSVTIVGPPWTLQRRLHPRYTVDLPASVRRMRQGISDPGRPVQVVDLSHGGARVVGAAVLEVGDTIELDLDVGAGVLAASGRVAMAYPDAQGRRVGHLSFVAPDAEELQGIDEYLSTPADRVART